jgi:feruloyl esterase
MVTLPGRGPALAALGSSLALLAASGCGNLGTAAGPAPRAGPQAACEALAAQPGLLPAATLDTRYWPPGQRRPGNASSGDFLGGHCVVTGSIGARTGVDGKPYATGFQLSLPDGWNGRLLYLGGGGNDGILRDTSLSSSISIGTPSPLGQGYAVVSTDAGHQGPSGVFGLDPVARIDHAFASHEKTALAARRLIEWRYGGRDVEPPAVHRRRAARRQWPAHSCARLQRRRPATGCPWHQRRLRHGRWADRRHGPPHAGLPF